METASNIDTEAVTALAEAGKDSIESDLSKIVQYFHEINIMQPINEMKLKITLKEIWMKQQQHPQLVSSINLDNIVQNHLTSLKPSTVDQTLTETEIINALQFLKVISEESTCKVSPLLCPPKTLVLLAEIVFPQVTTLIHKSETTSTSLATCQKSSSLLHKTVRVSLNLVKAIASTIEKNSADIMDKKATVGLEAINNSDCWGPLHSFGIKFLDLLTSHPTAALDIKSNAGLVVSHLTSQKFMDQLLASLAKNSSSESSPELSSVESANSFEKSVREFVNLEYVNKVALCIGALGTRQHFTMDFMLSIANSVLLSVESNSTKEAVNLGSARVLEIWMDKLNVVFTPAQLRELFGVLNMVEIYIFTYLAGHIDAVKNCCRNMLSNLSVAYSSIDDKDSTLLTELLHKILAKPYHVKWASLSAVTRKNPQSVVLLNIWNNPAEQLLCSERTFKNAASDVYLSLMKYTFALYESSRWVQTWITPLLQIQVAQDNESNWPQKKFILTKAMSFKNTDLQQRILATMIASMTSTSESFLSLSIESCLLIVECLKIGTELGVPIIQNDTSNSTQVSATVNLKADDLFRGVLPRDIFDSWAFNANPQIRLATFSLLVETKKTSEIFNQPDFEAFKKLFRYSLVNQNPAFRQQFMAYFKKLMRRLKDGKSFCKRSRRVQDVENYEHFTKWLWSFFTREGLFAGANFSRRCQSLDCIVELLDNFPVESLTEDLSADESLSFIRWLGDTYENNKVAAVEILSQIKMPALQDDEFCKQILETATRLLTSVKPPDSVTSRYLLLLLLKSNKKYYPWNFLRMLLTKLEMIVESLKKKKSTLLEVSSNTPPYGILRAIRLIFETYKNEIIYETTNLKKNEKKALKSGTHPLTFDLLQDYFRRLLTACFDLDYILFPVLGDAAPEGFLPDLNESDTIIPENSKIVRSINAQMLLVSSWRSMKEICILLTELCVHFPLEGELDQEDQKENGNTMPTIGSKKFMLSFEEVKGIGNHLLYLLMNLMHRGVFEQVFVGFKSLAVRLKKSSCLKLNKLSEEWLEDIMWNVKDKSTTRRSAGLPFIFQAILTPETGNESKITYWMTKLLELDPEQKSLTVVRIHSMNVLRALFRDANFSRAIMSWVPDGIRLAFIGLRAKEWAEQNSGLMLYGSVIRRTFGPRLNLMSAPTFFRKFPQMYDFLLGEIKVTAELITKCCNASVSGRDQPQHRMTQTENDFAYHVLLLFSCFSTAPGKLEEGNYRLAAFIPYIQACGACRDIQVRTIAAKAVVPFITSPGDRQKVLENSLDNLIFHSKVIRNNGIHGDLLQLIAIVHLIQSYEEQIETPLIEKFQIIIDIVKNVKCPVIFETFANLSIALNNFNQPNLMSTVFTMQKVNQESFEALFPPATLLRRNIVPGLPDADEVVNKSTVMFEFNKEGSVATWIESGSACIIEQLLAVLLIPTRAVITNPSRKQKQTRCEPEPENEKLQQTRPAPPACQTFSISQENNVMLMKRFLGEEFNFQYRKDYESKYLTYFASDQFNVEKLLDAGMTDEQVTHVVQKMISVCEGDFGTIECKAMALRVLAKFLLNNRTSVCKVIDYKDTMCDLMLEWTDSKSDDELRLAVAASLPTFPITNGRYFTDLQFCKIWSSAFILAQDDEIFIRSEVFRKLSETNEIPGCSLRCLELFVEVFFQEITKQNTVEGFWTIMALLLKDDFDVVATGADDEDEDRLFERSEMNMFAETVTLTNLVVDHLTNNHHMVEILKTALNAPAKEDHLIFFNHISHVNVDFKNSEGNLPSNIAVLKSILSFNDGEHDNTARAKLNANVSVNDNTDSSKDPVTQVDTSSMEDLLCGHEKEVVQQFIRRRIQSLFV